MKDFSHFYSGSRLPSLFQFFKVLLRTKDRSNINKLKEKIPFVKVDLEKIHNPGHKPQLTWLGHSSILLQHQNINLLFDPVFSNCVSPFFFGPKRYTPSPIDIKDLPPIDTILISHNHYDHLDAAVVNHFKNETRWIIPKGLGSWFTKQNVTRIKELSWWKTNEIITATPAQHWSQRTPFDTFHSLWCSYVVQFADFKFFFGADTGFNQKMFQEIGKVFTSFDLAALPIGAYDPEWFMHPFHINPEEAVEIHHILKSARSIPIHWGTFPLSFEPITEPVERLHQANIDNFKPIAIGETIILN